MTHGYEYFDIEYEDIDLWDWDEDFLFDEQSPEELWSELEGIYNDMAKESDEYDIYWQSDESKEDEEEKL